MIVYFAERCRPRDFSRIHETFVDDMVKQITLSIFRLMLDVENAFKNIDRQEKLQLSGKTKECDWRRYAKANVQGHNL